MENTPVPTFAILGHPNEGKSSVVSTLAEDDSVRISPIPGETQICREYPVIVDGRKIIRFIDTPGFQQPRHTLKWLSGYSGPDRQMLLDFINEHAQDPEFNDECELLTPLADGAGIIFVVDGSRPVRSIDKVEMEILRLTGLPRMVVINTKEKNRPEFIDAWKFESRKHFNTIRLFDAHRATYAERIDLLESIKNIDPDCRGPLEKVIMAFREDWHQRIADTVNIILDMLAAVSRHTVKKTRTDESQLERVRKTLQEKYQSDIHLLEKTAHKQIRKRFKHNIFNYELPPHSIIHEDLFSKKTRRFLGLKHWQLAAAGAAGGGAVGAKIDLATAGQSLGIFTAVGGLLGGGSAMLGARQTVGAKVRGLPLGRVKITVGPMKNEQILYILIDRALLYFSHIINWAHSRRDQPAPDAGDASRQKQGVTSRWDAATKRLFSRFFKAARKGDWGETAAVKQQITDFLVRTLKDISELKEPLE